MYVQLPNKKTAPFRQYQVIIVSKSTISCVGTYFSIETLDSLIFIGV